MKTRQLLVLEYVLSYGIRAFINGLKLRFASHSSSDETANQAISFLIDKIDDELKDMPEQLFEHSKLISDIYYKIVENYKFDEPEQLFGASSNILDESSVLILRYAAIYEALQVLPANYPITQKQQLEKSLRIIEEESGKIQAIFKKLRNIPLAESVHDSIVILKAAEQNIPIKEADKQQRKRWE